MADILDDADRAVEAFHREAMSKRMPEGPKPTGVCYNCGCAVDPDHRWCDAACRDDWQARQPGA